MRVAVSADMEGISQLADPREILACASQYWDTGKARMEADVAAACEGLMQGGASELVVLDNHASGNPLNISPESLPAGARLERCSVFELSERGVDACFHVGYHARGGVDGFLSHTYVPGLRLRVGGEPISESHGRAWAAGVPLLGIVGNDAHERTLGSLDGTPYLVVQRSHGRGGASPAFAKSWEGLDAIAAFARECMLAAPSREPVRAPAQTTFTASMPNGADVVQQMLAGGWTRAGEAEFAVELERWSDAQEPLAAAMAAAFAPFLANWQNDLFTRDLAERADREKARRTEDVVVAWAHAKEPEWYAHAPDGERDER